MRGSLSLMVLNSGNKSDKRIILDLLFSDVSRLRYAFLALLLRSIQSDAIEHPSY